MTTLETSPSAPARRPLSGGAAGSAITRVVMMGTAFRPARAARAMAILYPYTILLYRF